MTRIGHPRAALDAYLDGELDAARGERVATHLARCPPCRRQASLIVRVRSSLRAMAGRAGPG